MIKKIWLFFLSAISIFWFWVSFADIILEGSHWSDKCIKITNPHGIPWYKLVVWRYEFSYGRTSYSVYDVIKNKCLPQFPQWWSSRSKDIPYLINKNINIKLLNNLSSDEFESRLEKFWKFIKLDQIYPNWWYTKSKGSFDAITYWLAEESGEYKLVLLQRESDESWILEIEEYNVDWKKIFKENLILTYSYFIISWLATVLIETLVLFLIAKFCRKSWPIKNRKIIVVWMLASTVTLPLLRFVLPMFFSNYLLYVIIWEILVTVIETFIIKYSLKIEQKMAIFASIICNLCSFIVWLFIF